MDAIRPDLAMLEAITTYQFLTPGLLDAVRTLPSKQEEPSLLLADLSQFNDLSLSIAPPSDRLPVEVPSFQRQGPIQYPTRVSTIVRQKGRELQCSLMNRRRPVSNISQAGCAASRPVSLDLKVPYTSEMDKTWKA